MSSFSFRLKKLILSNGTPCDILKSKSYNCFPSAKKRMQLYNLNYGFLYSIDTPSSSNPLFTMNEMNTFLIKSPQSIIKEKKLNYTTIFRSGSMKDLHRESYLNELTTMNSMNSPKNLTRNNSITTQKLKTKVESYTNVLKEEHMKEINSPLLSNCNMTLDKQRFIFNKHFQQGKIKKLNMLTYGLNYYYPQNNGRVDLTKNIMTTTTAMFGRSLTMKKSSSTANLSLLKTSTSSYFSYKKISDY